MNSNGNGHDDDEAERLAQEIDARVQRFLDRSDEMWTKNPFEHDSGGYDGFDRQYDGGEDYYEPNSDTPHYDGTMPPWIHKQEPWTPIDLANAQYPDHPREWLIDGWLPLGETIGLSGPGGEGKTLIAQMLANAARCGGVWLGLPVAQMKSALLLCEDVDNDTLWRQQDIAPLYNNPTLRDLAPWILLMPRRHNEHNYLGIFDRDDQMHETVFFAQLLKKLKEFADGWPLLTVIDCKSDVFWGKQNVEQHARQFVKSICDRIARETNGIVILIYHPSLTGMREGTGSSGSVQWDAAFGARLYFASENKDLPDTRTLTLIKANHAQKGKTIEVQWEKGVFRTTEDIDAAKPTYETLNEINAKLNAFRTGFDTLTKRGERLSPARTSVNYAPKLIQNTLKPSRGKTPLSLDDLIWAMNQLIEKGELIRTNTGSASRPSWALERPATTPAST